MAQTKRQTKMEPPADGAPTMENGFNLIAMILHAINGLKLTRQQLLSWTENKKRLRAWIAILSDINWNPPSDPGTSVKVIDQGLCTHTDSGVKSSYWKVDIKSLLPYIERSNEGTIEEILEKDDLPPNYQTRKLKGNDTNITYCEIVGDLDWGINVLRSMFKWDGFDDLLIAAFNTRNVVWSLRQVISYIQRIIHDSSDDPLSLQTTESDIWFPYSLGWSGTPSYQEILKNIKFIRLSRSHEKHLGRYKWDFRTIYTLDDFMRWKNGYGDVLLRKGDRIYFQNSPLP